MREYRDTPQKFKFPFEDGQYTIGRAHDNAVCIKDKSVSRHHAKIIIINRKCILKDLGSHNGSFVNGMSVKEKVLKSDDEIRFGKYNLKLGDDKGYFILKRKDRKYILKENFSNFINKFVYVVISLIIILILINFKKSEPTQINVSNVKNHSDISKLTSYINYAEKINPLRQKPVETENKKSGIKKLEKMKHKIIEDIQETKNFSPNKDKEIRNSPESEIKTEYEKDKSIDEKKGKYLIKEIQFALDLYAEGKIEEALINLNKYYEEKSIDERDKMIGEYIKKLNLIKGYYLNGLKFYNTGDFDLSIENLKKAIDIDRGINSEKNGYYKKAIKKLIAENYFQISKIKLKENNLNNVKLKLETALKFHSDHRGVLLALDELKTLAREYYFEGYALEDIDIKKASEKWKRVLQIASIDDEYFIKARNKLKSLNR